MPGRVVGLCRGLTFDQKCRRTFQSFLSIYLCCLSIKVLTRSCHEIRGECGPCRVRLFIRVFCEISRCSRKFYSILKSVFVRYIDRKGGKRFFAPVRITSLVTYVKRGELGPGRSIYSSYYNSNEVLLSTMGGYTRRGSKKELFYCNSSVSLVYMGVAIIGLVVGDMPNRIT